MWLPTSDQGQIDPKESFDKRTRHKTTATEVKNTHSVIFNEIILIWVLIFYLARAV